jgi:hypothetical protein
MGNNKYTKRKHGKRHSANKGNVSRRRIYRMRGGDDSTDKKEPTFMDTVKDSFGEFANKFTGEKTDNSSTTNTENMDVSTTEMDVKPEGSSENNDVSTTDMEVNPETSSENIDVSATETEVKPDTSVVTGPTEAADNSQELAILQQKNEQLNNEVAKLTAKNDELTRDKEEAQENFAEKLMKALMKLVSSEDSDTDEDEDEDEDDRDENPDDTQENPDDDSL